MRFYLSFLATFFSHCGRMPSLEKPKRGVYDANTNDAAYLFILLKRCRLIIVNHSNIYAFLNTQTYRQLYKATDAHTGANQHHIHTAYCNKANILDFVYLYKKHHTYKYEPNTPREFLLYEIEIRTCFAVWLHESNVSQRVVNTWIS